MADKIDLRNMVLCFRQTELQALLGVSSESRDGRKTDLMQRALSMIDRGVSSAVESKIRDLYRKSGASTSRSSLMYSRRLATQTSSSIGTSASSRSGLNFSTHYGSHRTATSSGARRPTHGSGARHEVVLKTLPFYDVIGEVMKPSSLVPRSTAKQQEMRFSVTLTQQQCDEIKQSKVSGGGDYVDNTTQIQLRFCVRDTSYRQSDKFPSRVVVRVNNEMVPLPNVIPTNKPGAEPKRPGRPVNITHLCYLSASVVNNIVVSWNVEEDRSYCVAVYLVRKLNSDILLDRLRQNSLRRPDYSKALIREKLSLDRGHEIATTSLCVSLICPLGKIRMKVPCRSVACDHLQCFDAITYLRMNEKKPTWFCPVCDRHAEYSKLIIDGLILDILNDSRDSVEVALSRDGSWQVTQTADPDLSDDDDDDDEYSYALLPPSEPAAASDDDRSSVVSADGEAIDLTASDDENTAMSSAPVTESDATSALSMSENSTSSFASDTAAEVAPELPPMPPEPVDPIPVPPTSAPPLPPLPSSPVPPPEPDSAPPLPMSPPPMPPAAIGSPYPKISVSPYSTTPSYCYPAAMPNMPFMAYPSAPYGPAAYSHMQMPPNGVMYDYMSAMSGAGMVDYSAFTVANNYGYASNNDGSGPGQH